MWFRYRWLALEVLFALLSAAVAACGVATPATVAAEAPITPVASNNGGIESVAYVDDAGNASTDSTALENASDQITTDALSDAEVEGLLYMREEEKLARDVYLTLYDEWGVPVFQNIANSEQTHTNAVRNLLDRYDIEDPVADNDVGVFVNSTLQALYDQLVEEGSRSLADALRVGAAIEEIDILDLEERIAQTDNSDIQLVFENLMKGSRNHLRAFISNLKRQAGETYQPQYLSQAAFESIVDAPTERGRGRGS
jgi:hypothetical protein